MGEKGELGDGGLHYLVVGGGGEDLGLLCRDDGVAGNELGHDSTNRLDTERQRVHVNQKNVLQALVGAARQNAALNSRAVRDGLVRVDALVRLLAVEEALDELLNLGDTGRATDKNNLVNVALLQVSVLQNLLDRLQCGLQSATLKISVNSFREPKTSYMRKQVNLTKTLTYVNRNGKGGTCDAYLEKIVVELLKLGAGERLGEVEAVKDGLNLDAGLVLRRQSTLGLLDLATELLNSTVVFAAGCNVAMSAKKKQ